MNVKEDRAQTREMGVMEIYSFHAVDTCRYRVLTRLRRNVSFIDPNPMPMAMTPIGIGTIGRHCRPVHRIDIKGFQCFDHCFTEGHLRGTPWALVGKPRGEQTSGQTIKGHAADISKPSQLTAWAAGDVFVH